MSEWLDLMLEEISRKKRESEEAEEELRRREDTRKADEAAQSK
ncbi:MAG: hypothetical protein WBN07_15415 [Woeseiaceae bacterium]